MVPVVNGNHCLAIQGANRSAEVLFGDAHHSVCGVSHLIDIPHIRLPKPVFIPDALFHRPPERGLSVGIIEDVIGFIVVPHHLSAHLIQVQNRGIDHTVHHLELDRIGSLLLDDTVSFVVDDVILGHHMDIRVKPLLHFIQHPLDHYHCFRAGGCLVGTEAVIGIALHHAGFGCHIHIPLHPIQDFLVVGEGQVLTLFLLRLIHLSQGSGHHQGDLIPGDGLLRTEVSPVVVAGHHHARVQGGFRPALGGQPVVVHVVQTGFIVHRIRPGACSLDLNFGMVLHPRHRLAAWSQMDRVQYHLGELCPGDGLLRLEGPVGVAVHPAGSHRFLDLCLGPVVLHIRETALRGRCRECQRHHHGRRQKQGNRFFP